MDDCLKRQTAPATPAKPGGFPCVLTALLEPTNEWYTAAKIANIKLAQAYRQQHCCDFICTISTAPATISI